MSRYSILGAALFLLSGCGTIALRHSFDNYSDTYAETQNRQMLLNLARLSDREPIYFFQLAQISAGYTFTETVGLGDTKSIGLPTSTTANIRTANATLGGTATHNPVFTLVPLGGDKFATQLLAPIKPEIFYDLYEEGWPVDLLMRVLIERIELVEADPALTPPPGSDAAKAETGEQLEIMINDPLASKGGHFDRFLRACALARDFQKKGILYLDISDKFEPLAEQSVFPYPPSDQQLLSAEKEGLVWKQIPPTKQYPALVQPGDTPEKKDAAEAKGSGGGQAEHNSHELEAGNWQLGKNVKQTLFKLNQAGLAVAAEELDPSKNTIFAGNDNLMGKFQLVLKNGIGVTDTDTPKGSYHVRLVMRSLLGSMLAMANEQKNFQAFADFKADVATQAIPEAIENARRTRDVLGDPKDLADDTKKKEWTARDAELQGWIEKGVDPVPESENHPVLVLNWPAPDADGVAVPFDPATKVTWVAYNNKDYFVADHAGLFRDNHGKTDGSLDTWNRDVFRLLVQLSLQVTADPSTFALPSLLQSH